MLDRFFRKTPADSHPVEPGNTPQVEISEAVALNHASLSGQGPFEIVTPEGRWHYAVAFPLKNMTGAGSALNVRVALTVEEGILGAIAVAENMSQQIGADAECSAIERERVLEIHLEAPAEARWLVIRNTSEAGASRGSIRSVTLVPAKPDPASDLTDPNANVFEICRRKWVEIPVGPWGRRRTSDLMALSDERLREFWNDANRKAESSWSYLLYRDVFRGKRVLDVGAGMGLDSIPLALAGAVVTFADIVESNLELLQRLCGLFGVQASGFCYLENLASIDQLPREFDAIWCQGSMLHAPFEFARKESQALLQHLPVGGRWMELAYPKERWLRDGSPGFDQWGKITDGANTPWAEWYDLDRIRQRLQPAEFDVILNFNMHNDDFNWFDLIRRR